MSETTKSKIQEYISSFAEYYSVQSSAINIFFGPNKERYICEGTFYNMIQNFQENASFQCQTLIL